MDKHMNFDVLSEMIGSAADRVPGARVRRPKHLAGRFLEEAVEFCLASGLSLQEIAGHIQDSMYNQCLKLSKQQGYTVFPSQASQVAGPKGFGNPFEEMADMLIVLFDMCYVMENPFSAQEAFGRKLQSFLDNIDEGRYTANERGLLYRIKDHIIQKEGVQHESSGCGDESSHQSQEAEGEGSSGADQVA